MEIEEETHENEVDKERHIEERNENPLISRSKRKRRESDKDLCSNMNH